MKNADEIIEQWLRRKLNSARADLGVNWDDVVVKLAMIGVQTTASSLMTKHSRASFKAVEYIQILVALGVTKIDLPVSALIGTNSIVPPRN